MNFSNEGSGKEDKMQKVIQSVRRLAADEKGAAMLEYTVLLGIILVAAIAAIVWSGQWASNTWSTLTATLSSATT